MAFMIKTLPLLLLFLVVGWAIPSVRGFHMSIANFMGPNIDLTVHCASPKTKLGIVPVRYSQSFGWDFDVKGAHWECELISVAGNRRGIFFMFDEIPDAAKCGGFSCMWRVKPDGMYLFLAANKDYIFQFPWPPMMMIQE